MQFPFFRHGVRQRTSNRFGSDRPHPDYDSEVSYRLRDQLRWIQATIFDGLESTDDMENAAEVDGLLLNRDSDLYLNEAMASPDQLWFHQTADGHLVISSCANGQLAPDGGFPDMSFGSSRFPRPERKFRRGCAVVDAAIRECIHSC